jgi:23S rRNA pseudouridine2604 synthase
MSGFCSRREADKYIEQGRVTINEKVAKKGNRVQENDRVAVDGERVRYKSKMVYIALHKPPGITCTTDRSDKTNIIDFVNHRKRIFPIGRLDKPSTGLILLTNDGGIVNQILRKENNHEKEYVVKVNRLITNDFIKKMGSGVQILGTITKNCKVERRSKFVFTIVLTQGLNRQIRRMCEHLGYKVNSLKRVRIMNIKLDNLKPGHWRNLTSEELKTLKSELKK